MRRCPTCNLTFTDDYVFCTDDGTTLVEHIGGEAPGVSKFSVSWETPTQVVERPQQPQPSDASKWLYLIIGTMAAIIAGLLVFTFILPQTKKNEIVDASSPAIETPRNGNVAASNQNENVFALNQNVAVNNANSTPIKTPESNVNSASNVQKPAGLPRNFNRTYAGTVNYDEIEMQLERSGSSLEGRVYPKYRSADIFLEGYISDDGSFEMDEKSDIGVVTGVYHGRINTDGTMSGSWTKPDGSKSRPFFLRLN